MTPSYRNLTPKMENFQKNAPKYLHLRTDLNTELPLPDVDFMLLMSPSYHPRLNYPNNVFDSAIFNFHFQFQVKNCTYICRKRGPTFEKFLKSQQDMWVKWFQAPTIHNDYAVNDIILKLLSYIPGCKYTVDMFKLVSTDFELSSTI